MPSTDHRTASAAIAALLDEGSEIDTLEALAAYVKGEKRPTVLEAAETRRATIEGAAAEAAAAAKVASARQRAPRPEAAPRAVEVVTAGWAVRDGRNVQLRVGDLLLDDTAAWAWSAARDRVVPYEVPA